MTTELQTPVVVGVDGSDESMLAVRYAVQEARRLGCGLRLVHAVPDFVPMAPMLPLISSESLDEVGHRLVNHAKQLAYDLTEDQIEVETVVRPGSRVHVLVAAAQDAAIVVLGHRDRSVLERVFTGSTTTGVAARAHCPVVSVPATWSGERIHGRIVVGVEEAGHAREALAAAFAAATARNATVTVLHAWKLQSPYDEAIASRVDPDEWVEPVTKTIQAILAEWREAYPDVDVVIDVRHQSPAAALVGASEDADLLVLGRRGHGAPLGIYLGSTVRTLIRESSCPVVVAPPRPADERANDLSLTADQASPQT